MWGHTTNNTLCIVWFAVCYNASQYSCVEIVDITPMNSPQLQYLPVMFPPLGNMLLLLEVFIFTIGARSFCLNLENFFLSDHHSLPVWFLLSINLTINIGEPEYFTRSIDRLTDFISLSFPHSSPLAFRTSNVVVLLVF